MRMSQVIDPATGTATPIPVLGLGCSRVGSFGNPAPPQQVRETLAAAMDLGVTLFDTADIYGQGDSEREIGRVLRGRRDKAFVVTKFGKTYSWKMALMRPAKPLLRRVIKPKAAGEMVSTQRERNMGEDFGPAHLRQALDGSLRRLGSDYVDAVLLHSPSATTAADPRLAETLAALKAAGKTRHFGVSCDDRACLEAAFTIPGLSFLQLPIDVIDQAAADGLLAHVRARGVAIQAREVIRLRGARGVVEAVADAARRSEIDNVVAGASHPERLRQLAEAVG